MTRPEITKQQKLSVEDLEDDDLIESKTEVFNNARIKPKASKELRKVIEKKPSISK